jgi:PemK-like, MazF-like toxin of type II toxin-antitoxin system
VTRERSLGARIRAALREQVRRTSTGPRSTGRSTAGSTTGSTVGSTASSTIGPSAGGSGFEIEYSPRADGLPDPGEIVWTWVPYEEDASQGKDRPVLIIGRRGSRLVALMLTSKDHDRDAAQEAREGRHWMDVGTGAWDRLRRPSEVRLDRLLTIDPAAVRREGAALDAATFRAVVAHVQSH